MYILFDIGASKMRLAGSRNLRDFFDVKILKTAKNFNEGISLFVETAKRIAGKEKITAIAGGAPGPLSKNKDKIINAPNLKGWNNQPLKARLERALNASIYIENDTAIVGLGEVWHGAGKRYRENGIVAYVTVSTGVGGVRIVDGKIDRNSKGFEIGSQYINIKNGFLEKYIAGRYIEQKFHRKPYEIKDKKVWDNLARLLAYGLNNTIVHWSPDAIILGGSMINGAMGNVISVADTKAHLNKILKIFPQKPKLIKARLGDLGGLYGAMVYLKNMRR